MPLYDCMLLLKPTITSEAILDLVTRVGKHVFRRNGVLTDVKCFGSVQLGYGINKLDGRYYQAQLMQMTMMTPPSFNSELYYLNKEDRLLRWLLVKHRNVKIGEDLFSDFDTDMDLKLFKSSSRGGETTEDDNDDEDEDNDNEVGYLQIEDGSKQ